MGSFVGILVEVLFELFGELLESLVVVVLVFPGVSGVEDLRVDSGGLLGDGEVENGEVLVLDVLKFARVNRVQNGSGHLQAHSLAVTVFTARPASVDEPDVGIMLLHFFGEHVGVESGVEGKEGLTEAGGESSDGFLDSHFGSGDLGGVSRNEVEFGLSGSQFSDRRQHTVSVTSQKHDVLGVTTHRGELGVGNVLQGVRSSGVFSNRNVVEINSSLLVVQKQHVLHQSTELQGVVNLRLFVSSQTNALRVATALDVENTTGAPAVFVVSEEFSVGVSGEGGFSGSRETEKESDITVFAFSG